MAAVKQLGSVLSPWMVGGLGELPAASLSPVFPNPDYLILSETALELLHCP